MRQYKEVVADLLQKLRKTTNLRDNRTGIKTISKFGHMMRFDLKEGFPLVTLKRTPFKSIVAELLWFISGNTSNNVLENMGSTIWQEWALTDNDLRYTHQERLQLCNQNPHNKHAIEHYVSNQILFGSEKPEELLEFEWLNKVRIPVFKTSNSIGDLGPIYQAQWRRVPVDSNEVVFIDKRTGPEKGYIKYPSHFNKLEPLSSSYTGDLAITWDNNGDEFSIIEDVSITGEKNSKYKIQFTKTGYVTTASRANIRNGGIRDPYAPSLFGVAALGKISETYPKSIYNLWMNMISRCYNHNNPSFEYYGAKGIYVSPRWLCFENFYHDIKQLLNYEKWAKNPSDYHLDKDYFESGCYDVSTCLFLKAKTNQYLSKANGKYIKATSPDGESRSFCGIEPLVEWLEVSQETFRNYRNGRFETSVLDGWIFEDIVPPANKLVRMKVYIDQLSEVIDGLKRNPGSRRLIVSAWNMVDLPDEKKSPHQNVLEGKMALAPCHVLFQFYVEEMDLFERAAKAREMGFLLENIDDINIFNRWFDAVATETVTDEQINALRNLLDGYFVPSKKLSCMLFQRSCDVALGLSFNIASYALLTHLVARECGYDVGEFIHVLGDYHLYQNQFEPMEEILIRDTRELPSLWINPEVSSIFDLTVDDIRVDGYNPHPPIKMKVAV